MDKLPDSEIVKALEDTLHRIKGANHLIVPKLGVKNLCNGLENALDLINRLQADCENYKQVAENQQKITLDKGFEIKELKAEIERLKKGWKADILLTQNTKVEAYKECIEKVKEKSTKLNMCHNEVIIKTDYQISGENLDNLLKELKGND